eukprot:791172-Prymnesium_polylepis.2
MTVPVGAGRRRNDRSSRVGADGQAAVEDAATEGCAAGHGCGRHTSARRAGRRAQWRVASLPIGTALS